MENEMEEFVSLATRFFEELKLARDWAADARDTLVELSMTRGDLSIAADRMYIIVYELETLLRAVNV